MTHRLGRRLREQGVCLLNRKRDTYANWAQVVNGELGLGWLRPKAISGYPGAQEGFLEQVEMGLEGWRS